MILSVRGQPAQLASSTGCIGHRKLPQQQQSTVQACRWVTATVPTAAVSIAAAAFALVPSRRRSWRTSWATRAAKKTDDGSKFAGKSSGEEEDSFRDAMQDDFDDEEEVDNDDFWGDFRPAGESYAFGGEGALSDDEEQDDDSPDMAAAWDKFPSVGRLETGNPMDESLEDDPMGAGLEDEYPMGSGLEEEFTMGASLADEYPMGASVAEWSDDEEDEASDSSQFSSREMNLLYDDFEVLPTGGIYPNEVDEEKDAIQREQDQKFLRRRERRNLESVEEREYVVTAEGIAVRTLPDERSPRTGEMLRQGDKFTAVEAVDGEDGDQRLYLRLPQGRGWVFDDERVFPGFPSVQLLSINGTMMKEAEPEPVKMPLIAVVGRPNVGKSTLVNKICDLAECHGGITWDESGVTRDRTYKYGQHTDDRGDTYMFEVIDTGGLIFYDDPDSVTFRKEIKLQIDVALREAVAAVFVVDSRVGCTAEDLRIAEHLKKNYMPHGLKVVLAVAKCDLVETEDLQIVDFWQLEMGRPMALAAIYGRGVWEVLDKVVDRGRGGLFPMRAHGTDRPPTVREDAVSVAVVGKQNAGKSSLFNALIGEARSIVSDIPGTTTESIDAYMESDGKVYRFIDTAGIRRTKHIQPGTEWLSVNRSLKAAKRADVTLLVLDAAEIMSGDWARGSRYWCPDQQHRWIARQMEMMGSACVVVLSKWDAVPKKDESTLRKFIESIRANLAGVGQWAEIVSCSAVTGQRLKKILDAVDKTLAAHRKRIPTPILNEVVRDALLWRLPAARSWNRKQGRVYYACQVAVEPPVITIFCNHPKLFGPNYKIYLENKLRQDLGWFGTPIQLEWRKRAERRAVSTAEQWLGPRLQPTPEEAYR